MGRHRGATETQKSAVRALFCKRALELGSIPNKSRVAFVWNMFKEEWDLSVRNGLALVYGPKGRTIQAFSPQFLARACGIVLADAGEIGHVGFLAPVGTGRNRALGVA
jgi:hypothetical protein